jgi:GTP cyclohydrolase II
VRLLTNNPSKVAMLESCGLNRCGTGAAEGGRDRENAAYLATKAAKSGHLL